MEALRSDPGHKHGNVGDYNGQWKKISNTVKKLGAFSKVIKKRGSQNSGLAELESKFYSEETKRILSQHNSKNDLYLRQAPHYTQPSKQADSLGDLPQLRRRNVPLPPINTGQAIQKRIRRKRSMVLTNSYQNLAVGGGGSHVTTPRVLTDEDRFKLRMKFKGLVRVFLAFKRIWLYHKGRVDEILQTFKGLDSLVQTPVDESQLLFNVRQYKAKKQSTVSHEVKRILSKHPSMRTPDDIHTLIVFMGSYATLAEYPMFMQRSIAQRAWYEWYDAKRVIVREGHTAYSYFYVLSGSAVMSTFDPEATESKTVNFINRGDSFGDSCLMNGQARECTTISKEFIELLVLRDEDFADIFMSGGLRNAKDSFIEGLSFMEGFPVGSLFSGSTKTRFTYFKKGSVIVTDSIQSDWIYIVKSGHCSVVKKLKSKDSSSINSKVVTGRKTPANKEVDLRRSPASTEEHEKSRIDRRLQELIARQASNKDTVQTLNFFDPAIKVPMNGLLDELRGGKTKPLPPITPSHKENERSASKNRQTESITSHSNGIEGMSEAKSVSFTQNRPSSTGDLPTQESAYQPETEGLDPSDIDLCIAEIEKAQSQPPSTPPKHFPRTKGPYFKPTVSNTLEDIAEETAELDSELDRPVENRPLHHSDNTTEHETSVPLLPANQGIITQKKIESDVFITVQSLKPGSHFGLIQAISDNFAQPSLSLVSHGAECILLHKKFFLEMAPLKLLDKLREELFPYPSDEKLQQNLEVSIYWEKHKQDVIQDQLTSLRLTNIRRST